MSGISFRLKTFIVGLSLLAMAGCTASYRNHGYAPNEDELAELVVGVDTRDTVEEVVGTPTTAGVLSDRAYYYVQSRVRHFAYQRPKVIERQVLAISFDDASVISNIERFTLEDGQVVPLSRRVTSSGITDKSFLRQLMGNLGQFSAGDFLN